MIHHSSLHFLESESFPFYAAPYYLTGGRKVHPHSHEFVEFVYIVEGKGMHFYKGIEHQLHPGDAFIIEPGVEHAYLVSEGDHLHLYNLLFQPDLFSYELELLCEDSSFFDFYYVAPFMRQSFKDQPSLWFSEPERAVFKQLLDDMVREFTVKEPGYRAMIRSKLVECFVFLSRCYRRKSDNITLASESDNQSIQRIIAFIESHSNKQLTLTEVCRLCGMSSSTFTVKFKAYTGRTFLEYRNEVRITAAKRMLVQSTRKIIAIAHDVGFEDVSLFNRTFRELTGLNPSNYRKLNS